MLTTGAGVLLPKIEPGRKEVARPTASVSKNVKSVQELESFHGRVGRLEMWDMSEFTRLKSFLESFRQFLKKKSSPSGVSVPSDVALSGGLVSFLYLLCKHVQTALAVSEECIVLDCATPAPLTLTHTAGETPPSHGTVDFNNTTVFAGAQQTPG